MLLARKPHVVTRTSGRVATRKPRPVHRKTSLGICRVAQTGDRPTARNVFCAQCDDRRCPTCEKVVEDGFSLNGSVFHGGCIKCEFCRDVLDPSQLHLEVGAKTGKQMPYCKVCFKEQLGRAAPEVTAAATTSRRPANSESDHGAGAVRTTEATTRVREIPVCPNEGHRRGRGCYGRGEAGMARGLLQVRILR